MCGVEGRRGVCGMSRRKPISDHQTFRTFFCEVTGRGGGGGGSAPLGGRRRKGGGGVGTAGRASVASVNAGPAGP